MRIGVEVKAFFRRLKAERQSLVNFQGASGKCKGPDMTSQILQKHINMVWMDSHLNKITFADQASIMNDDIMPKRWLNDEGI